MEHVQTDNWNSPGTWENPVRSSANPGWTTTSDQSNVVTRPLVWRKQRLPRKDFRGSIAWLSDSLSTLRSSDYSNPTQDSLLAAGQALPDGLSTRRIPMKGFKVVDYISFPFPKLCLAQLHRPTHPNCSGGRGMRFNISSK